MTAAATEPLRLGVFGTGALGSAVARAVLRAGVASADTLILCNRSGRAPGFGDWPSLRVVRAPQTVAESCDLLMLAVPPAALHGLELRAEHVPILSVVAGATVAQLQERTGSARILRAMSSPAAEIALAYSPIFAASGATEADRACAARVLGACGEVDFIDREEQIDEFTAMTGPVPGFVAFFARCMVEHATGAGIDPAIADRAVRQLFLASGQMMAQGDLTPDAHVRAMIDYDGTTAAGLRRLEASGVAREVHLGLAAAVERVRAIARPPG